MGQFHYTVSTDHNFWIERTAEADSNRGPSAYQPNALPLKPAHSTSVQIRGNKDPGSFQWSSEFRSCESRGGRPGLPSCGRKATLSQPTVELRNQLWRSLEKWCRKARLGACFSPSKPNQGTAPDFRFIVQACAWMNYEENDCVTRDALSALCLLTRARRRCKIEIWLICIVKKKRKK